MTTYFDNCQQYFPQLVRYTVETMFMNSFLTLRYLENNEIQTIKDKFDLRKIIVLTIFTLIYFFKSEKSKKQVSKLACWNKMTFSNGNVSAPITWYIGNYI